MTLSIVRRAFPFGHVNTWFNRLAFDASLPEAQRKTWTIKATAANAPLEIPGLVGPVLLRSGRLIEIPR